ncbi:MAG: hypothetical protein ACOX3V_01940 [Bacillota bacterium]
MPEDLACGCKMVCSHPMEPGLTGRTSGRIEVDIAADSPCCPGIAFRVANPGDCEMFCSRPHASGEWDALQYDPIFNYSNTWQIYHGEGFQKQAHIPMGKWYTFFVEYSGNRAVGGLVGQEPLAVETLATPWTTGGVGIWTHLPAYFADLRIYDLPAERLTGCVPPHGARHSVKPLPSGIICKWLVQGHGVVTCEPNGVLNLNRYFPLSQREVLLTREFCLDKETTVAMSFGLSDDLTLFVDGVALYTTTKAYRPTAGRQGRGYVEIGTCKMTRLLGAGKHRLEVRLRVSEPYGWGLAFSLDAQGLRLLPVPAV